MGNNSDRNTLLAIVLSVGIFAAWQILYVNPMQKSQVSQEQAIQNKGGNQASITQNAKTNIALNTPAGSLGAAAIDKSVSVTTTGRAEVIEISRNGFSAKISTQGGVVESLVIPDYRRRTAGEILELIGTGKQLEISTRNENLKYIKDIIYTVSRSTGDSVVLSYRDDNLEITRSYNIGSEEHVINHDLSINFKTVKPDYLFLSNRTKGDVSKDLAENERRELIVNRLNGKQEKWTLSRFDESLEELSEVNWVGFSSRYFLNALVNEGSTKAQFSAEPAVVGEGRDKYVVASLVYRVDSNSFAQSNKWYCGPKDISLLKSVGKNLDMAVDFGWFTVIAYPMLKALHLFYKFLHNYGLAIILLTVIVKLLTYPLTYSSMKSMKKMQKVQPQLQALREKYKDDKEALNRETLLFMRTQGYNPVSGCLPMFVQMPIFVALYNVLFGAIELQGMPFFGWIQDLSAKDPFYVTPVVLGLLMFVQQKLSPQTVTDPAQQKMMTMMPVIFGVMMLWLPAGLTLYMLVNSLMTIAQTFVINSKLKHA